MWEVLNTHKQHSNKFFCVLSRHEFVQDFQFHTPLQIMKQNQLDIPRMKTVVMDQPVKTVEELDRMLRLHEFSFDDTLFISQLCTQTSLAYAYERALSLYRETQQDQDVHLGSLGGRHTVHIRSDSVTIMKVLRVFKTGGGERKGRKCTVKIDANLRSDDVSILISI